jgi:hypothetical protein
MLSQNEINIVGQLVETGWGAASELSTPVQTNLASVTGKLMGDTLALKYVTVVNIDRSRPDSLQTQISALRNESDTILQERLKQVKSNFKSQAGRALKSEVLRSEDDVEMIGYNPHNPKATAYYRRHMYVRVE